MFRFAGILFAVGCIVPVASAQDYYPQAYSGPQAYDGAQLYGGDFYGPASVGSSEPLFSYDDVEPWKHGYLQIMPYYGGHHLFLPYNYKAVFSQSQVAAGWGMPNVMPYSQQFWHRYEQQADLSQPRTQPAPVMPQAPTMQPGYLQPTDGAQPWYLPTSQYAPATGAVPTAYVVPSAVQSPPAARPLRGGQSLKGPALE